MMWFETAVCNCSHPRQPFSLFSWGHSAKVQFSQVFRASCLVGILSIAGSSPGDATSTTPSYFLRSLLLSSLCLGCLEDVTWPILEKFHPLLFSKLCIVFYYRCLNIFFLSLFLSPPFFVSAPKEPPSLSNKMSPHKMNQHKWLRVYQTSYQTLCFEQRAHTLRCVTLCLLPSVVSILEKRQ